MARNMEASGVWSVYGWMDVSGGYPPGHQVLGGDRPFVIDFRTDPAVPPIPPHASLDQIEAAASAVVKGASDRVGMIRQGLKAKVQDMLPGGKQRQDKPEECWSRTPPGTASRSWTGSRPPCTPLRPTPRRATAR